MSECVRPVGLSDHEEQAELDMLVDRYDHRVRYFARRIEARYGLDVQWRDDLVSAGYWGLLKALRNRRANAHDRELSAYVSRRVEGAVLDEARRVLSRLSTRADCDPDDLELGMPGMSVGADWEMEASLPNPENLADQNGRWRTIEQSVDHLEPECQELLWAYADGRSISEIARQDGSTPARLQGRLTRLTRQIRARSPELRRLLRHEL